MDAEGCFILLRVDLVRVKVQLTDRIVWSREKAYFIPVEGRVKLMLLMVNNELSIFLPVELERLAVEESYFHLVNHSNYDTNY